MTTLNWKHVYLVNSHQHYQRWSQSGFGLALFDLIDDTVTVLLLLSGLW